MISVSLIFFVTLAILAIAFLKAGIKLVPQGQKWTVERFGRYTRTLDPGLSLLTPFFERVGHKLSVMEQVLDVPSQTVISRDNASVTADAVVFFRINNAPQAAYQVQNLPDAIMNLTTTNLRSVLGSMELDEMLSNRETINAALLVSMDKATEPWGVKVTRIEIRDLSMSAELQAAMNLQMTAERKKRAVITQAEGQRNAEVLQARGEQEAAVLRAEGEKQAAILRAEAREREAEAEAKATKDVSEAIAQGGSQATQYFLGLKYIEALQEIGAAKNSKLVLMPLEASGITGAIAGVSEIFKATGGAASVGSATPTAVAR